MKTTTLITSILFATAIFFTIKSCHAVGVFEPEPSTINNISATGGQGGQGGRGGIGYGGEGGAGYGGDSSASSDANASAGAEASSDASSVSESSASIDDISNKSVNNISLNTGGNHGLLGVHSPSLGGLFGAVSGNNFSCASNVGFNVSFIGGFGFQFPWTNDRCEHLVASAHLAQLYGVEVGCNYLVQNDEVIAKAFHSSSVSCKPAVQRAIPVISYTPPRLPHVNHPFFDNAHKAAMLK